MKPALTPRTIKRIAYAITLLTITTQSKLWKEHNTLPFNAEESEWKPIENILQYKKLVFVFALVFVMTLFWLLVIKCWIDLAMKNKIELIQMKESYLRIITDEINRNPNYATSI